MNKTAAPSLLFETPLQRRLLGFLQSLKSQLGIETLNDVFDFESFSSDAEALQDPVPNWERICFYLRMPVYAVFRALSVVRLRTANFKLNLFHMLQNRETMIQFISVAALLNKETRFATGRDYISKVNVIEHNRTFGGLLYVLKTKTYSLDWINQPVLEEASRVALVPASPIDFDKKVLLRSCGLPLDNPDTAGLMEAFEEIEHKVPKHTPRLPNFDKRMLMLHLTMLTYAHNRLTFRRTHVSTIVLNYINHMYNDLFSFLLGMGD